MQFRLPRTFAGLAAIALLVPALAACAPAAAPAPTATAPAKAAAPAAKPAAPAASPAAAAAKPAASPVAAAKPAASPAAPAAKPAASPAASPAAKPAASPAAQACVKPTFGAAPTGNALGSAANPLKMAFVPSQDSQKVLASGEPLAKQLQEITGLNFRVSVPTSFTAVIEAMGASQVDIGWLNPFGYVLAHDKYGTEVILATVRQGSKTYRGQIIAHADSGINKLEDLKGKKFAFVDAASTSGFLFPNALLAEKGIDYKTFFSETIFAGKHDSVVIAVYNKQVDAGATFGNSKEGGPPTDARTLVQKTLPDVMQKVKVIAETDPIPNDTVSVRKGLDADLVKRVRDGLLYLQCTQEGQKHLKDLYNINGLAATENSEYDVIRRSAKALNLDLEEQIAPKKKP